VILDCFANFVRPLNLHRPTSYRLSGFASPAAVIDSAAAAQSELPPQITCENDSDIRFGMAAARNGFSEFRARRPSIRSPGCIADSIHKASNFRQYCEKRKISRQFSHDAGYCLSDYNFGAGRRCFFQNSVSRISGHPRFSAGKGPPVSGHSRFQQSRGRMFAATTTSESEKFQTRPKKVRNWQMSSFGERRSNVFAPSQRSNPVDSAGATLKYR